MTMDPGGAATDACAEEGRAAEPCESDPESTPERNDPRDNPTPSGRSLSRKISRRLSLVAKVPNLITVKLKQELGSRDSLSLSLSLRKTRSTSGVPGTPTTNGPPDLLRFSRSSKNRLLQISIIAPDKTQRIVTASSEQSISDLVAPILDEFGLTLPDALSDEIGAHLSLAGSQATVDPSAEAVLLDGEVLIMERIEPADSRGEIDGVFRLLESATKAEKRLAVDINAAVELYGLRHLAPEELLDGLLRRSQLARNLAQQLSDVLATWDPEKSCIGCLFATEFWQDVEDYQSYYIKARAFIREKCAVDEDFAEVLRLRRGAARYTLDGHLHLPVERLAQYEQLFEAILIERSNANHPDNEDLSRARSKANEAVKRGEESDLERIQDLFPNDCLRLYDKDALTMKMKGLILKRTTTAARLSRALSTKSTQRPERTDDSPIAVSRSTGTNNTSPPTTPRQFLMEAPVQFTAGVQSQERHLFLFNDMLLVAKSRSGGNFKLKDKVRVSELWLTRCAIDDVIEVNKSRETSFVMGWPTTNVVATFGTQAARDIWWSKLNEVVATESEKEPKTTNIQVIYYDAATNIEYSKTFSVGPDDSAKACIRQALDHLEMRGLDPSDFQLWVKTPREEAPYPLIGHERPFAIKLSCLRDSLSTEEGFDLDHCNNVHDPIARCQFILRNTRKPVSNSPSDNKKTSKKSRKSPIRIRQVFKRSLSKGEDTVDSSSPCLGNVGNGCLFGVPLARLCGDSGELLPPAVQAMLHHVFLYGPFTQGIFRRSANARLVRELRDKLDSPSTSAEAVASLEHVPVFVTAALLKDFLRSLPEPLLGAGLYSQWMEALESREPHKLMRVKSVLDQLPKPNQTLLSHFLCVLHHVERRSPQNLMSAGNLGVCVGPSLLWLGEHSPAPALTREIPSLVEFLVLNCQVLIGPHVTHLLGDPPERDPSRQDSGAEESDSLHSGGLRRDDSSIDSLERELMEPCPPPRKDKMSLSRDSGLTMSDSQLYTPDEEESGSTSSSGSGRGYAPASHPSANPHTKQVTPPLASGHVQREYVRVYGGWEERVQECCRNQDYSHARGTNSMNPNFQRQDWFRQRSHLRRLHSGNSTSNSSSPSLVNKSASHQQSTPNGGGGLLQVSNESSGGNRDNRLRRSASEESLLNGDCYMEGSNKRPALHSKGRAPAPPTRLHATSRHPLYGCYQRNPMARSKSAHHLAVRLTDEPFNRVPDPAPNPALRPSVNGLRNKDSGVELKLNKPAEAEEPTIVRNSYSRSFATPGETYDSNRTLSGKADDSFDSIYSVSKATIVDENYDSSPAALNGGKASEESYDSSTLSDDDSTPHVSRSNSRSKDSAAVTSAWESVYGSLGGPLVHAAPANVCQETAPPVPPKLRHLPPVHVEVTERRGRSRRRGLKCAQRSKSLPPPPAPTSAHAPGSHPPPYRHPPSVIPSHRAPITTFYLGDATQSQRYVVSQRFVDQEESYV